MSYQGYRVKINGTIIPNVLVASGSYSFNKQPRIAGYWTDSKGEKHMEYHEKMRSIITFSIRERNLEEHESIKDIFNNQKKVNVEYWDDYECVYHTGVFDILGVTINHKKALSTDILYNATQIRLEER